MLKMEILLKGFLYNSIEEAKKPQNLIHELVRLVPSAVL